MIFIVLFGHYLADPEPSSSLTDQREGHIVILWHARTGDANVGSDNWASVGRLHEHYPLDRVLAIR